MENKMKNRDYRNIALLFFVLTLIGCFGGGKTIPIKYYLIDPVDYSSESIKPVRDLSLAIIDLHLPQYLERFHIATRVSENQLSFSETHQWGENLRKNLLRTLARNLSGLLSTVDIGTPLNRSASNPDYLVQLHIDQFEMAGNGIVKLVARWQLSVGNQYEPVDVFYVELENGQPIDKSDYQAMITSMQNLFGELSERIADTILQQEE